MGVIRASKKILLFVITCILKGVFYFLQALLFQIRKVRTRDIMEQQLELPTVTRVVIGLASQVTKEQPHNNCCKVVLECIRAAKKSIDIWVYWFASSLIADEIIKAVHRGVEVRLLVFEVKSSMALPSLLKLFQKEIAIRIAKPEAEDGQSHVKMMIFDKILLLSGSFNLTVAASTRNDELITLLPVPMTGVEDSISYFSDKWNQSLTWIPSPSSLSRSSSSSRQYDVSDVYESLSLSSSSSSSITKTEAGAEDEIKTDNPNNPASQSYEQDRRTYSTTSTYKTKNKNSCARCEFYSHSIKKCKAKTHRDGRTLV